MKLKPANRLEKIETSIFSTITQLAYENDAVNLGQGFPDFNGEQFLMEKAFEAMKEGKNQYAPAQGTHKLREQIKRISKKFYDIDLSLSEILITTGATEGLYASISAFIEKGDEVVIFEPYFDAYKADVLLAGGIPKYVTLKKPDFTFDPEELNAIINNNTKMIIVNSPHNPTGKVFSREELETIAYYAKRYNLLVLSDEAYEYLTFDDKEHIPFATIDGMYDRTVTVSSTGKTFGMTGWKIGYIKAKEDFIDAILKVRQWSTYAVNTPGQHAMAYGFSVFEDYLKRFRAKYLAKRNFVLQNLEETIFKPHKPYGTYYIMVDLPEEKYENDLEAVKEIIIKHKVALIPPSAFYEKSREGRTMLRICFAKKEETLAKGMDLLKSI